MQELTTFINHHPTLVIAAVIIFILLIIVEFMRAKRSTFNINPAQATQMMNHDNAIVIDIRPSDAYRNGHIIDARSIPAQELRESTKKLEKFKNKPLIFVCNAGTESQKIAAFLLKQGYNAFSLAGGMRAWSDAEMPVVKE